MRFLWLFGLLALSCAQPALSQNREGYIAADDGTKLFYKIEGSGPQTLVVVHGGPGGSLESVRPDFGRLAQGRTVIYYDQRGNGRSDLIDDETRVGIDYQVADLDAVRRHFKLEKLTLLGNSWGGFLISAYAAAHPDRVERLILDVPAPPKLGQLEQMGEEIDRRVEQRMSEADRRHTGKLYRAWETSEDPMLSCKAFYHAILIAYAHDPSRIPPIKGDLCNGPPEGVRRQQLTNRAIWRSLGPFDYRPAVQKVTAPVLVIHGVSDVIPVEGSQDCEELSQFAAAARPGRRPSRAPRAGGRLLRRGRAVPGGRLARRGEAAKPVAAAANSRDRCRPPALTARSCRPKYSSHPSRRWPGWCRD